MENVEERLIKLKRSKRFREDAARIREEIARAKHKFLSLSKMDKEDEELSAKEVSRMFEDGSLNREGVLIHEDHGWFAERYALELYVDPQHDHPPGFDPFQSSVLSIDHGPGDDTMTVRIDLKTPIEKVMKDLVHIKREMIRYRKRGHEKYSAEELRRVESLMKKGSKPLDIFHRTRPEFRWFHPRRDYHDKAPSERESAAPGPFREYEKDDHRKTRDFEAYNAYQRCLRLITMLKKPSE